MFLEWRTIPPNGNHPLFAYGRDAIYRVSTRRTVQFFGIFRMEPNHEPSGKILEPTLRRQKPCMDADAMGDSGASESLQPFATY